MIHSLSKLFTWTMIIILSATGLLCAADYKWTSLRGPDGGSIMSLAIDPSAPQTIYAGTYHGGIFKSTNGGNSWSAINTGLMGTTIYSLAIDPVSPQTLYAGTNGGVYKSTDGGSHWSDPSKTNSIGIAQSVDPRIGNIPVVSRLYSPSGGIALAIDPASPQTVYAGYASSYGGLFKSTDGGKNWSAADKGLSNYYGSYQITALAVDPREPQTLYAGTQIFEGGRYSQCVFKSTNGGSDWSAFNTGLTLSYVCVFAVDPSTLQTLYAGGKFDLGGKIFKSTNGGGDWKDASMGLNIMSVSALAIDPTSPQTIYAGTAGSGLFKSMNGGESWSAINIGLSSASIGALVINPTTPQTLYAGADNGGVFKSTDGGSYWSAFNKGLSNTSILALAIDPTTPQTIYAAANSIGVFKSTNGGSDWGAVGTGLTDTEVHVLAIDPSSPRTIYAGTGRGGVFKSTDEGNNWSAVNTGLKAQALYQLPNVYALAIDPSSPQTIYAGTYGDRIFKSTNGGSSWSAVNTGLTNVWDIYALAIDPASPQTLYGGSNIGVFKSTNGGNTWSAANTGLTGGSILAVAIDPSSPQTIYAGTYGDRIFKSTDGGGNWSAVGIGLVKSWVLALAIDPTNPQTLFAGTDSMGVYRSTNGGTNWSSTGVNYGIFALAIDPTLPQTLYAGTDGSGVWGYLSCNDPAKPTLISPSGITNAWPTYSWNAVAGAEQYQLWVNDSSTEGKIKQWYTAAEVDCPSGKEICSITASTSLAAGAAAWWIQAWNGCGGGSYSSWSDAMKFTVVDAEIPGKATLISPTRTIRTNTPVYSWNAVWGASWYQLWVNRGADLPKIQSWYSAIQAGCSSGTTTCSVTPDIALATGEYQWWIQTWNDSGYGPWSNGMAFIIGKAGSPGKAALISPSGTIATTKPTYTWDAVLESTWYCLWVNDSIASRKIVQWYEAADVGCELGMGTCSVTPAVELAGGSGGWRIQTWNDEGYGPWSDGMRFTVESGTTGLPDIEFALVPAGEFQMGSTNGFSYEQPVHRVIISKAFQLGKYEITQAQWKAVMGSNPSNFTSDDLLPVERVSWSAVQAFITKLNAQKDGYTYRLPTEAEWEYACRGGTTGDYGGTGNMDEMGWHYGNSDKTTHLMGTKKPNAWELYDMHGNVLEWVQDWYDYGYYSSSPIADPPGPTSGSSRVNRGGDWASDAYFCRSAYRRFEDPQFYSMYLGFRLLRTAQ